MRLDAVFHGRVQGVGFRWTACRFAARRGVRGWVMNMPDGTVRLAAEGEPDEVRGLIADLKKAFAGYITRCEYNESDREQGLGPFDVRFHK